MPCFLKSTLILTLLLTLGACGAKPAKLKRPGDVEVEEGAETTTQTRSPYPRTYPNPKTQHSHDGWRKML